MAAEPVPVGDMADSDGGGADTDGCSDIDVANMHDEDFLDEGEVGDMAEVVGAEDPRLLLLLAMFLPHHPQLFQDRLMVSSLLLVPSSPL